MTLDIRCVPRPGAAGFHEDTKAALGLLDVRHLAGDPALTARLRGRRSPNGASWLASTCRCCGADHAAVASTGRLAFLLDGDLKEARGGLRDVRVLRGVAYAQVADAWRPQVRAGYTRLLDVRDGLHIVAGRRRDRLFVQDLDDVSAMLGLAGPEALRRRIADDARTIAYAVDDSLRAAERWVASQRHAGRRASPAIRSPVAPDVVAQDGEVVLARTAVGPVIDPTLSRCESRRPRLGTGFASRRGSLGGWPGTARHCPGRGPSRP
jgi:[protein-PII] uridylyltransferase